MPSGGTFGPPARCMRRACVTDSNSNWLYKVPSVQIGTRLEFQFHFPARVNLGPTKYYQNTLLDGVFLPTDPMNRLRGLIKLEMGKDKLRVGSPKKGRARKKKG